MACFRRGFSATMSSKFSTRRRPPGGGRTRKGSPNNLRGLRFRRWSVPGGGIPTPLRWPGTPSLLLPMNSRVERGFCPKEKTSPQSLFAREKNVLSPERKKTTLRLGPAESADEKRKNGAGRATAPLHPVPQHDPTRCGRARGDFVTWSDRCHRPWPIPRFAEEVLKADVTVGEKDHSGAAAEQWLALLAGNADGRDEPGASAKQGNLRGAGTVGANSPGPGPGRPPASSGRRANTANRGRKVSGAARSQFFASRDMSSERSLHGDILRHSALSRRPRFGASKGHHTATDRKRPASRNIGHHHAPRDAPCEHWADFCSGKRS